MGITTAQLQAKTAAYFRERHPGATNGQIEAFVKDYFARVDHDSIRWADRNGAGIGHGQRDYWAREVEAAATIAMAVVPSPVDLANHVSAETERQHGRAISDVEKHKLLRQFELLSDDTRLAEAQKRNFPFKSRAGASDQSKASVATEVSPAPASPEPAKPNKPKRFSEMDVYERRDEIARRLGRDPASLLASDLKRFGDELLRMENAKTVATKPKTLAGSAKPTGIPPGMTREAFNALPPQERIRLARRAARDGK